MGIDLFAGCPGFEPGTARLTVESSTAELTPNKIKEPRPPFQRKRVLSARLERYVLAGGVSLY